MRTGTAGGQAAATAPWVCSWPLGEAPGGKRGWGKPPSHPVVGTERRAHCHDPVPLPNSQSFECSVVLIESLSPRAALLQPHSPSASITPQLLTVVVGTAPGQRDPGGPGAAFSSPSPVPRRWTRKIRVGSWRAWHRQQGSTDPALPHQHLAASRRLLPQLLLPLLEPHLASFVRGDAKRAAAGPPEIPEVVSKNNCE